MILLGVAALAMWLSFFVFAPLVTHGYAPLTFIPPIVGLTLLLGLVYQQLLEVLAGITRRPVASGVFLGFYGWLFSSESRFTLLLLFRPYPYTLAVSPQFSYWVVTEGFANRLVGLTGDALAIFLGWSVAISVV